MKARGLYLLLGAPLLCLALLLPSAWYDPLPSAPNVPPAAVNGLLVLRIAIAGAGAIFLLCSLVGLSFRRLDRAKRFGVPRAPDERGDLSRSRARKALWTLTAVALGLRLFGLDSSLWLDEITPRNLYADSGLAQIWVSYRSSNNHLLNSLLVQLSVSVFGEHEWAIRLPASLFGTATIPACYWAARLALSRWASLAAALLLACSYHHVFFSQNSRGYAGYILWAVVSSVFLIRALAEDRASDWTGYLAAMLLCFASIPTAVFVFASHVAVGAAAALLVQLRAGGAGPLVRRLLVVFAAAAYSAFLLYAVVLPQMLTYIPTVYSEASVGFQLFSWGFASEVFEGLSAGVGFAPFVAVGVLGGMVGTVGLWDLARRNWLLATALLLPNAGLGACAVFLGYLVAPRFFLLMLIPAAIVFVAGVDAMAGRLLPQPRPALGLACAVLLSSASLATLERYYRVPKQDFRGAVRYVAETYSSDTAVIVVDQARGGFRYYAGRFGIPWERYVAAKTDAELERALAEHGERPVLLVTTLRRILHINSPEAAERIEQDWREIRSFPGTIGGGRITIWGR